MSIEVAKNSETSFLEPVESESNQTVATVKSFLKIGSIDHHSCDVDWSDIDLEDFNVVYDPTMCFTLVVLGF